MQVPSVTGEERAALERLGELAGALGLEATLHRHDLAALRAHPDHPGEEAPRSDLWGLTVAVPGAGGGLGSFAALERDAAFDACLIPEPFGFDAVCAQAGALTFRGTVRGVGAHAALRLEGVSAIDRYLPVHAALAEHERRLNDDVEHPLMRRLALPYPVVVGRLAAGEWSSSVPDRLVFEAVELAWTGGQFASAQTPADHPFTALVRDSLTTATGRRAQLTGVPSGTDMRLFTARGIACVMTGTPGLELAHAVDERVRVADVLTLAQVIMRVVGGFSGSAGQHP